MTENRKVKNATETIIDGIKFRSKLEARAAQILKESNISFSYEPFRIEYIPKFEYMDEKFRAATYTPDFVIDGNIILEIKGFITTDFKLKRKYVCNYLKGTQYKYYEIKSLKQLKEWINEYKKKSL